MNSIYFFALMFLLNGSDCTVLGDGKKQSDIQSSALKNRFLFPENINADVTLLQMYGTGHNDENEFESGYYTTVTGYVYDVKSGGAEDCNCHAQNDNLRDTHIEICIDENHTAKTDRIVCEITPSVKIKLGLTTAQIKKEMKGKNVSITGYMFFDREHRQNAYNTQPDATKNIWRRTCWEIHPVSSFRIEN